MAAPAERRCRPAPQPERCIKCPYSPYHWHNEANGGIETLALANLQPAAPGWHGRLRGNGTAHPLPLCFGHTRATGAESTLTARSTPSKGQCWRWAAPASPRSKRRKQGTVGVGQRAPLRQGPPSHVQRRTGEAGGGTRSLTHRRRKPRTPWTQTHNHEEVTNHTRTHILQTNTHTPGRGNSSIPTFRPLTHTHVLQLTCSGMAIIMRGRGQRGTHTPTLPIRSLNT